MRRAPHFRALVLVTLKAGVGLELGLQLRLARHALHDRVATGAHQAAGFVRASAPQRPTAFLMAGEADRIVLFRGARLVFGPERGDSANAAAAAGLDIRRARTMAILAIEFSRLSLADLAHQRLFERLSLGRVAGQANFGANNVGVDGRA